MTLLKGPNEVTIDAQEYDIASVATNQSFDKNQFIMPMDISLHLVPNRQNRSFSTLLRIRIGRIHQILINFYDSSIFLEMLGDFSDFEDEV